MNKLLFGLLFVALLSLEGCVQQPGGAVTQYVCSDGAIVADVALCAAAQPGSAAGTGLEAELDVCVGMPELQTVSLEDLCIIGIAGKHEDSSVCKEVSRDRRGSCYTVVAEEKEDPSACEEAGSDEDSCYSQYASDTKDSSVCSKIRDLSRGDSCYYSLANNLADPALCGEIMNIGQKDSCYSMIAQRLGDTTYCERITSSTQKESCLQNTGGARIQLPGGEQVQMPVIK